MEERLKKLTILHSNDMHGDFIPKIDEKFNKLLEADLRVVWRDKIGMLIIEPSTEDINNDWLSAAGGLSSSGEEFAEYIIKSAPKGKYTFKIGSGYSKEISPPDVTITVYKNWGRPNQSEQTIVYYPVMNSHKANHLDEQFKRYIPDKNDGIYSRIITLDSMTNDDESDSKDDDSIVVGTISIK